MKNIEYFIKSSKGKGLKRKEQNGNREHKIKMSEKSPNMSEITNMYTD